MYSIITDFNALCLLALFNICHISILTNLDMFMNATTPLQYTH